MRSGKVRPIHIQVDSYLLLKNEHIQDSLLPTPQGVLLMTTQEFILLISPADSSEFTPGASVYRPTAACVSDLADPSSTLSHDTKPICIIYIVT